jgi:hypothetical protein
VRVRTTKTRGGSARAETRAAAWMTSAASWMTAAGMSATTRRPRNPGSGRHAKHQTDRDNACANLQYRNPSHRNSLVRSTTIAIAPAANAASPPVFRNRRDLQCCNALSPEYHYARRKRGMATAPRPRAIDIRL